MKENVERNTEENTARRTDKSTILVLGASGRVGSHLVCELDQNSDGVNVRLATSQPNVAEDWKKEGRDGVVLDLDDPNTFRKPLQGVDRVFLLTGYSSDMLYQSKKFVDAAVEANVKHIVHLGVFTTRKDNIPHFAWHDLIETYIAASGIAWTNIHPNVIADGILMKSPSILETGEFSVLWVDKAQGWVFAEDIAAVAAAVLREGPEKHGQKDYFLSTEVLTGPEVASIISNAIGHKVVCKTLAPDDIQGYIDNIDSISEKAYMESARITMQVAAAEEMKGQVVVRDDVMTVLGRPGITVEQWTKKFFKKITNQKK